MSTQPSKARNPDLDWSQVRETVSLLNMAAYQIEWSLTDSDDSVNALTRSFTAMVDAVQEIRTLALAEQQQCPSAERAEPQSCDRIICHADTIAAQMQHAIIAFQFYDRLTQRMNHLTQSLRGLGELVNSPHRLYNPAEWHTLVETIRGRYTTHADRVMFDAITGGSTLEEAIALYLKSSTAEAGAGEAPADEDIELF